ncbi:MAG TPA: zinc-binding dehydrogenase [Thermoanaerobaculia bacterium]|nr:zinc-binding dehydrogenase [Thermoanaerobaculia bacterium]
MKAVYFESHGGPEVLRYGERPDPEPGPGEVRVRIRAAALNHLDLFVRDGLENVKVPLPQIPGADGAGVVDAVGPGVDGVAPGERVLIQPGLSCGICEYCRGGEQSLCIRFRILGEHVPGTFADLAVVPARNAVPFPETLSFEEAAAFPLVYQTAWRMIVGRAAVRPGETVLIHGVGGAVAWAALQIARLCGAEVFATSSGEEKLAAAREAGAKHAWSSRDDVARHVAEVTARRGCDVVVDCVGDATWMISLRAAAKGGRIVTCGATSGPNPREELRLIFWKQISILGSTMANDREFRAVADAVFAGRLKPRIDSRYPFSDAPAAYARLESGRQFGKVVLAG